MTRQHPAVVAQTSMTAGNKLTDNQMARTSIVLMGTYVQLAKAMTPEFVYPSVILKRVLVQPEAVISERVIRVFWPGARLKRVLFV